MNWKVYQNMPDNYTDNPLAGFDQYRKANAARGNAANGSPYPAYTVNDETISPLIKGIGNTMPDAGFLQAFKDDIAAGKLPQVSWIVAPATYLSTPPSSPVQGAWYTQEVLNALTANPDIWSRTVLLINFDENDGFFDHVPPPCAPAYDGACWRAARPCRPTANITPTSTPTVRAARADVRGSPWSRGGWVNSQVFDHTSVLRFLKPASAWRRPISAPSAAPSAAT